MSLWSRESCQPKAPLNLTVGLMTNTDDKHLQTKVWCVSQFLPGLLSLFCCLSASRYRLCIAYSRFRISEGNRVLHPFQYANVLKTCVIMSRHRRMVSFCAIVTSLALANAASPKVRTLTDADFDQATSQGAWLIEFFAPWYAAQRMCDSVIAFKPRTD